MLSVFGGEGGIGCAAQTPNRTAAAIPFGGGFTQNEVIRYADAFFCSIGFAQARLARLFKQKNPAIAGLHFGWRGVRDPSRTPYSIIDAF